MIYVEDTCGNPKWISTVYELEDCMPQSAFEAVKTCVAPYLDAFDCLNETEQELSYMKEELDMAESEVLNMEDDIDIAKTNAARVCNSIDEELKRFEELCESKIENTDELLEKTKEIIEGISLVNEELRSSTKI